MTLRPPLTSTDSPANRLQLTAIQGPAGAIILAASGEADMETAQQLLEHSLRFLAYRPAALIISLDAVTFLDSRGLAALITLARRAAVLGVLFRLTASAAGMPARVLNITGLTRRSTSTRAWTLPWKAEGDRPPRAPLRAPSNQPAQICVRVVSGRT